MADKVGRVVVMKASSRSVSSGGSSESSADAGNASDDEVVRETSCGSWSFNRKFSGSGGFGSGLGIGKVPPDSAFFVSNSQDRCSSFSLSKIRKTPRLVDHLIVEPL